MNEPLPIIFVPGLNCSPRLYAAQIPRLWYYGPITVADHTRDDFMAGIGARILRDAPPRFVLVGLSMGGYVAFEIMRQAPERVARLALLDTTARPDTPEQKAKRREGIAMAEEGPFQDILDAQFPLMVHRDRVGDQALREQFMLMAYDGGPMAYINQQRAIMERLDARNSLYQLQGPLLVLVGDGDQITPPPLAKEIADSVEGSTLVIVPNCGHLSTMERPDEVSQALEDWIRA